MVTITLNQIRAKSPCVSGWETLLKHLGKTQADDVEFPLSVVLDSNGLDDTLWCLRCLPDSHSSWMRKYAVWCARQVQYLMSDQRSIFALDVAERYADGLATDAELSAAWDAARDAARDAALAAARAAALAAARDAAWDAAWDAALAAARAAAWAAAWDAALAAAGDAAGDAQTAKLREMLEIN
jgi:hypothetical protein